MQDRIKVAEPCLGKWRCMAVRGLFCGQGTPPHNSTLPGNEFVERIG